MEYSLILKQRFMKRNRIQSLVAMYFIGFEIGRITNNICILEFL